jgi:hypothetical protein
MKTGGVAVLAVAVLASFPAYAQSVVSVQAGLVHYTEGRVFVGDQAVQSASGRFAQMKDGDVLRTEEGRAEILLSPGAFLRMGEDSSVRLVSRRSPNSRIELLAGSAVLEIIEPADNGAVTLQHGDDAISIATRGIIRLDANPAVLRVRDGQATVVTAGRTIIVSKGSMLPFNGAWVVQKYNRYETDVLDRWSARRAEYLAMANVSAANRLRRTSVRMTSGWYWDSYMGMYAYVPHRGSFRSCYGYSYYSPQTVLIVYRNPDSPMSSTGSGIMSYDSNRGYSTVQATSTGNSGAMAASGSAPTTESNASTAPVSRDSGSAGGRTR